MWKEFKPAFRFLFVFLGLYLAGNIIYGVFVESYHHVPDPVTDVVAHQTSWVLQRGGVFVTAIQNTMGPTVFLRTEQKTILNIYEGCNGINVMVVFVAFVVAFGGPSKKLAWFLPLGILVIWLANIVRLVMLYVVAVNFQHYFYYVHKYVFTAAIYLIVLLLWLVWITKINGKSTTTAQA